MYTLVFDEIDDRGCHISIAGPFVRNSPFVRYIASAPEFSDSFSIVTIRQLAEGWEQRGVAPIYPVGVPQFFTKIWISELRANTPFGASLAAKAQQIKQIDNLHILLDLSWENASYVEISSIPELADVMDFPVHRLICIASHSATTRMSEAPARYGFLATGACFFEQYTHFLNRSQIERAKKSLAMRQSYLEDGVFDFDALFLSFNRRFRAHRLLLGTFLTRRGYISEGFFSFGGEAAKVSDNYLRDDTIARAVDMLRRINALAEAPIFDVTDVHFFLNHGPFELDLSFDRLQNDQPTFTAAAVAADDGAASLYARSGFSIVSETEFEETPFRFHLSEKTFKPILFGHPLVLLCGPGALAELQDLGYKSYEPLIGEDYDHLSGYEERFLRIFQVIDRTIDLYRRKDREELLRVYDIASYNQRNFIEGTTCRVKGFLRQFAADLIRFGRYRYPIIQGRPTSGRKLASLSPHGPTYYEFRLSWSGSADFDSGFYDYEPRANGRWCRGQGTLLLWLEPGDWELIFFVARPTTQAPIVRMAGEDVLTEIADAGNDRSALIVRARGIKQFAKLDFQAKWVFVPGTRTDSRDFRILGFWLDDRFLARQLAERGDLTAATTTQVPYPQEPLPDESKRAEVASFKQPLGDSQAVPLLPDCSTTSVTSGPETGGHATSFPTEMRDEQILINVALGRCADQSSTCVWSKPNDANRAVNGLPTGSYSFCTSEEVGPWWRLDLGSDFPISELVIYNREDMCQERAVPLRIELSVDEQTWSKVADISFVFGGLKSGRPLRVLPPLTPHARFIRLTRQGGPQHFHLDQVEVLVSLDSIGTTSQLNQDLWVLGMTAGRVGGSFFEIGSSDGVSYNNTLLLEEKFGWHGICVEPNPSLFALLAAKRTAFCIQKAMFPCSGLNLKFAPVGELGTIEGFEAVDFHKGQREEFMEGHEYIEVTTCNPNEILDQFSMPALMDYLSLDTEGTEWEIVRSLDFSRRQFGLITVEHNFVETKRKLIHGFLSKHGYHRISVKFDDWYYNPSLLDILNAPAKVDFRSVSKKFADPPRDSPDCACR